MRVKWELRTFSTKMVGQGPNCETSSIRKLIEAALAISDSPVSTFKTDKPLMYVSSCCLLKLICFETHSYCISLVGLELTIQTRLTLNSQLSQWPWAELVEACWRKLFLRPEWRLAFQATGNRKVNPVCSNTWVKQCPSGGWVREIGGPAL